MGFGFALSRDKCYFFSLPLADLLDQQQTDDGLFTPVLPALQAKVTLMPVDPSQHLGSNILASTPGILARNKLLWPFAGQKGRLQETLVTE